MVNKISTFISKQITDIKNYGTLELFRKFNLVIKLLFNIPIYIVAIIPCVIIRLIRPWIVVRIEHLSVINFGALVRHTAIYYLEKKQKINQPTKKCIDLFYVHPSDKIYNKQIIKMWKRKLNFLSGHFLNPIDKVNELIPGWKIHKIEVTNRSMKQHKANSLIEKYQPLNFTSKEEIYGKEILKKFGLSENDKFVCLAVRDEAYQLKKVSARFKDWSYHDHRNFDINNFIMAAESLAERGYYVFRMGVVVKKALNTKNNKIIDYANSNLRSDFMDVYLGAKCTFCISTGFGFEEVPFVFRRPIALIQCPFGDIGKIFAYSDKFLVLTKHHILEKENRELSLSEIFSHGVAYAERSKIFGERGIKLVDNTPEEIKDLVIEMANNLESKKKLNNEENQLQKNFKNLFAYNIKNTVPYWPVANKEIKARFST